jgi:hypothetical protein
MAALCRFRIHVVHCSGPAVLRGERLLPLWKAVAAMVHKESFAPLMAHASATAHIKVRLASEPRASDHLARDALLVVLA